MRFIRLMLILPMLTIACQTTPQAPLLLIHLVDVSQSAQSEGFKKSVKRTCHEIVELAKKSDLYTHISVDAALSTVSDPQSVRSKSTLHKGCQKISDPNSKKQGTMSCLAWERTIEIIHRQKVMYRPIVINQIQANEGDKKCITTLTHLGQLVTERQGRLLILNSTNQGDSNYNQWMWNVSKAKGLDNVRFSDENNTDLATHIETIRQIRVVQSLKTQTPLQ
jgi:hypothetical protein